MSAISRQDVFKHGSFFSKWVTAKMYVVYSYGDHWPLAVWTEGGGWAANNTKAESVTTARHMSAVTVQLLHEEVRYMSLQNLIDYVKRGGDTIEQQRGLEFA